MNISLMMEPASTSVTSVNFYKTTQRNNLENSHLYTRRPENQKSQKCWMYCDEAKKSSVEETKSQAAVLFVLL
jgi:hypothetical protein